MATADTYSPAQLTQALAVKISELGDACAAWAQAGQDAMRANAPWTDQGGKDSPTGLSARESLFAQAALSDDGKALEIVFRGERVSTRLWHGEPAPIAAFLELGTRRMHRKYDIIRPTMENMLPDLKARLQQVMTPDG